MNITILVIILFVIIIALILATKFFEKKKETTKFPYKKKDYLLSVAEKEFYNILRIVGEKNNYLLFAKVRLEDLLWIPKHTDNRGGLRNRIKSRHVDFLICDKDDVRPLLVIELDDSSHERTNRKDRDEFVNRALHDAGLPILHQKVQHNYIPGKLVEEIARLIENQKIKC